MIWFTYNILFLVGFLILFFSGPAVSKFFLGLFSGHEVHPKGAYTIMVSGESTDPSEVAETLDTFVNQMVGRYGEELHLVKPDPVTSGIKIYILESSDALETFGIQRMNHDLANNGGYFLPAKREIALVVTGNRTIDNRGLRHEMMHALMHLSRAETDWPNWFAEGMASFFEYSTEDADGWHPGGLIENRPRSGKIIPLKDLLGAGGENFTSEDNTLFYRSAQMLIEFLFTRHQEKLFAFYRKMRKGGGKEAFTDVFGDPILLENAWRAYMKQRK